MPDAATATWPATLASALAAHRIAWYAYVPDEVTGGLLDRLEANSDCRVVSVTREEEGVGVLAGAALAGQRGALVIQASGIGNSLNVLGSLCVPCKVPMLLIISERGGLNEFNPCQVPLGKSVEQILGTIGIQAFRLADAALIPDIVSGAVTLAFSTQQPVALMLTSTLMGRR